MNFKKAAAIATAVGALAAISVPAMALENSFHGFIKEKAWLTNSTLYSGGSPDLVFQKDGTQFFFVEQRARLLYEPKVSDDLKGVVQFEIDSRWGDAAYANGRNSGGGLEADTVNLETKNVYIDFKVPSTPVHAKAGIQNFTDVYKGLFIGYADTAGLVADGKLGSANVRGGWLRFWDVNPGSQTKKLASVNMYLADADFAINKDLTVGGAYYLLTDTTGNSNGNLAVAPAPQIGPTGFPASILTHAFANGANSAIGPNFTYKSLTLSTVGVTASAKVGPATLDGFVLGQFGSFSDANGALGLTAKKNVNVAAFAADARAKMNIGPGTLKVEGLYVSGDDLKNGTYNGFISTSQYQLAGSFFSSTGMKILLPDADDLTTSSAIAYDLNNKSQGFIGGFVGYDATITPKLYAKGNAGFAAVAQANANGRGTKSKSDYLGTEINGEVGYKLYDNLTASFVAAYVVLGDYYKDTSKTKDTGVAATPDNPYTARVMLAYTF